jgi:hypothetical protein
MNVSSLAVPAVTCIVTHWRRFSSGLWRVPPGDIAEAYCADTFPKIKVFTHEGRQFTNCGNGYSKLICSEVNGYPLIPADEYSDATVVPYSYQGRAVVHQRKTFRLGARVQFISSDPTVDEWRHLLRVIFADGGLFASGCSYQDFLVNRCKPETVNGQEAWFKEVAECGGGRMPRTKDEMRTWLEAKQRSIPARQLELSW